MAQADGVEGVDGQRAGETPAEAQNSVETKDGTSTHPSEDSSTRPEESATPTPPAEKAVPRRRRRKVDTAIAPSEDELEEPAEPDPKPVPKPRAKRTRSGASIAGAPVITEGTKRKRKPLPKDEDEDELEPDEVAVETPAPAAAAEPANDSASPPVVDTVEMKAQSEPSRVDVSEPEPEPEPALVPEQVLPPIEETAAVQVEVASQPSADHSQRYLLIGAAVVAGLFVAGGVFLGSLKESSNDSQAPAPSTTDSTTDASGSTSPPVAGREPALRLSGIGPRQSALFALPGGPATLRYSSRGPGFSVELIPRNEPLRGQKFSCTEACSMETPVETLAGEHYVVVDDLGSQWSVVVAIP